MKILSINGRFHSIDIENKVAKIIDDIFVVAQGKLLTESVLEELDTCFQSGFASKFSDIGPIDPKIIITMSKDGMGNLEFTPGNVWTLAFLNGYYVDPKLIGEDTEEIILGTETFRYPKRNKFNLDL